MNLSQYNHPSFSIASGILNGYYIKWHYRPSSPYTAYASPDLAYQTALALLP